MARDYSRYLTFSRNWGTHVLEGLTTGSRLKLFSTSRASNRYSEVDYQAKLCASYSGVDAKANACAGITDNQKSSSSSMDIEIQKHVLGGSEAIRNQLASSTGIDDPSLVQSFLDSSINSTSPVSYQLSQTVWDFMATRMGNRDEDNFNVNMFNRLLSTGYLVNGIGE
jgi:hypothetical protein